MLMSRSMPAWSHLVKLQAQISTHQPAGDPTTPLLTRRTMAPPVPASSVRGRAGGPNGGATKKKPIGMMEKARAPSFLIAWSASAYALIFTPHTRFKAMRLVDLPFVLWLQCPKNTHHQFITHGIGQSWAPMLILEVAYAFAYASKNLLLTRLLLLPLALYYWSLFHRIAQAEQRLRLSKGKTLSWSEYLCIYVPFALKSGFLASSACINLTAIVAVDLNFPQWIQIPVAYFTQAILLMLGAYSTAAQDSFITLGWMLWGLNGQPIEITHFTSIPTFFLCVTRGLKSAMRWATKRTSSIQIQKTDQQLKMFEDMVVSAMLHCIRVLRSIKVKIIQVSPRLSIPSTSTSSTTTTTTSASSPSSETTTTSSISSSLSSSLITQLSHVSQHPFSISFLRACRPITMGPAIVVGFLLGAMFGRELQPRYTNTLRYGQQLRVGESLQYRCSIMEYLSPLSCTDLDLILNDDGILRLYGGRARDHSEASLIWQSTKLSPSLPTMTKMERWRRRLKMLKDKVKGKRRKKAGEQEQEEEERKVQVKEWPVSSNRYIAQVDERSRLSVSLDNDIVFQSARLVTDPNQEPIAGALTIDGVLKAVYVTDGPYDSGIPTFVSTW